MPVDALNRPSPGALRRATLSHEWERGGSFARDRYRSALSTEDEAEGIVAPIPLERCSARIAADSSSAVMIKLGAQDVDQALTTRQRLDLKPLSHSWERVASPKRAG